MDATLRENFVRNKSTDDIAALIGVSRAAVQCRAGRLGLKRKRTYVHNSQKLKSDGHRPFTERCGELLREHGVDI